MDVGALPVGLELAKLIDPDRGTNEAQSRRGWSLPVSLPSSVRL